MGNFLRITAFVMVLWGAPQSLALCIYNGDFYAKTSLEQEFRDSSLVIKGKVLSNRDITIPDTDEDVGVVSRVQVASVFKGKAHKIVTYYSRRDSGGFYLDKGTDYLLFLDPIRTTEWAKDYPGAMVVNYNCGQSEPWGEVSAPDREQLRRLSKDDNHP